jgi:hypothetical protein
MKRAALLSLTACVVSLIAARSCNAATIPAGTTLVVKTADVIHSDARPGTRFAAVLAHNVAGADGKIALPAGTKMTGKVVTSKRMVHSRDRLTVDLVEVMVGSQTKHLKTAAVPLESYTSGRNVSYSPDAYHVAAGRQLAFRLGHDVTL